MGDGAGFRSSVIRLSFIRLSVSGEHYVSAAGAGLPPKAAVPSEPRLGTESRSSVAERRILSYTPHIVAARLLALYCQPGHGRS